jgi:hypothetical protein
LTTTTIFAPPYSNAQKKRGSFAFSLSGITLNQLHCIFWQVCSPIVTKATRDQPTDKRQVNLRRNLLTVTITMGLADFFDEAKRDLIDDISSLLNPREPDSGDDNGDAATIVQVVTQTAPKTFTGNAVLVTQTAGGAVAGGAVFASRTDEAATTQALETAAPTSAATSAAATTAIIQPTQAVTTPLTTPLTTPVYNTPFGAAVTSSLNSAQATNQSKQAANSGLSGGAKAGIAFGVLIPVAALLIGALILIRRKKQQKDAGEKLDDEKAGYAKQADALPSFPAPAPAPAPALAPAQSQTPSVTEVAVRSTDTLTAPRLSLRPQTQFDPRMSKLASPNGATAAGAGAGALTAAAAVGAAGGKRSPSPQSAWERPGAEKNSNDPANPFGDHAINNNAQPAPAPQPRASSPINIDAADFPLPGSVAPSERAISLVPDPSSDNLSLAPSNPATASNLSLIAPGTPTSSLGMAAAAGVAGAAAAGVAGAAAAGVAGAAAAGAANNRNSPPPADNVYRVQLDFEPSMEDELGIRAGQLVRILHAYDDGWVSTVLVRFTFKANKVIGTLHAYGSLPTRCRPSYLPVKELCQASPRPSTTRSPCLRSTW